jgi:hypothetical protein
MRKMIAAEFMTIDGVIRREKADGDGFKYGRGIGCVLWVLAKAPNSHG